jgi:GNAT superfamily N-acetyltransferase
MAVVVVQCQDLRSPPASQLIAELNADVLVRYPETAADALDHLPLTADEVAPGRGAFLIAYIDGEAAGCGAVRRIEDGAAEIKRMYVRPAARGRGVGTAILAALEAEARGLGVSRLVLETGERQPEAIALYRRAAFARIPPFGGYDDSPESVFMGKELR